VTKSLPVITFDEAKHKYTLDGEPCPSVTQIIKASDPFEAGPWWGMRVGFMSLLRLLQDDEGLSWPVLMALDPEEVQKGIDRSIESAVISAKLSVNHVRDERGDEGTAVHNAIESMREEGTLPSFSDYDDELRGYLRALSKWYVEQQPILEAHEILLGSRAHFYCGKTDAKGRLGEHGPTALFDFKTQVRLPDKPLEVYKSVHEQLAGYAIAYNELASYQDEPEYVERAYAVVLGQDGRYLQQAMVPSAEALFLATRERFRVLQDFLPEYKALQPKKPRKRKAT
jgi:hypothetical protein